MLKKLSVLLIFTVGISLIFGIIFSSAQQINDEVRWPPRPDGKKFRIWIKPVEIDEQGAMGEESTVTKAVVIWQTGKALNYCGGGGFVTAIDYSKEDGKKTVDLYFWDRSRDIGNEQYGTLVKAPRAPSIAINASCFLTEKNSPTIKTVTGDNEWKHSKLIQIFHPMVKFSKKGKPSIVWTKSQILDIDPSSFENGEVQCFGPAPCPTEIPDYVSPAS